MKSLLLFVSLFLACTLSAQNFVRGTVFDERKAPIPFATIFVKNTADQRTVANSEGKFELSLMPGEYFLVVTATGFQDRETYVSISNIDLQRDVQLFPEKAQDYHEVVINTKRTNVGREIMLKVVEKRDQMNPWNYPHSVDVYIKATENRDIKEKTPKKKEEKADENPKDVDPLESSLPKAPAWVDNMNLLEVQLSRNYAPEIKSKKFETHIHCMELLNPCITRLP